MRTCIGCGQRPSETGALCGPCRKEMELAVEANRKALAAEKKACDCKEPCPACSCVPDGE